MIYLVAGLSVILFAIGLRAARIPEMGIAALAVAKASFAKLSLPGLSDDERERVARDGAVELFYRFLGLALRLTASLVPPAILAATCAASGLVRSEELAAVLVTWPFVVLGVIACVATLLRW
ncbi:MAG: hypothetical protein WDN03_09275 [Rhizomicrobium sp.]